jgi:succinate dehydrogenase flavoprotein subunit
LVDIIDTDVLVIGGGAAGCTAAIIACDRGAKVTMIVKGLIGRSGCSVFAGNLNAPPKTMPLSSLGILRRIYLGISPAYKLPIPKQYKRILLAAVKSYMHYLVDQDYVVDAMIWAKKSFYPSIESTGLYLLRDSQGNLVTNVGEGVPSMWAYKMGFSGVMFMEHKRKEVLQRNIQVLEETSATKLLKDRGRMVGAVALDYARGKILAVRAKATILATGHTNWLAKRSTATREQAANGFSMAYAAGAELHNMEIQWWHVSDAVSPKSWMRLHNYPNPMPGTSEQARLVNSKGETFFDGTWYPTAVAPYFLQLKKLYEQVSKGSARWDGGYFSSYAHIEPRVLEKYQYHWEFYEKLGFDMTKDPIESAVSWHMTLGGVKANRNTMETKVPGLFVAGSVGGHYLGGIPFVCYDGTIAGTHAAERATDTLPELDLKQVENEEERILGLLRKASLHGDGPRPLQVKALIRQIMWDKMGFVKNADNMNQGLKELTKIREELLPNLRLGTDTRHYNYDLVDSLDLPDMLDTCEMAIKSSLTRQESRGPFYREEYPFTDNINWLRFVVIGESNGKMATRTEPIKCTYIWPDKNRENYFETDY